LIVAVVLGHHRYMFVLVVGMLVSVALGVATLCMVAIPARREGREVLTAKGEDVVSLVVEKTGDALETAREKTGVAFDAARDKVSEVTGSNEP
jgi:competence protein ComGC